MPANIIQLQSALQKSYDRLLFAKDVLRPIFNSSFTLNSSVVKPSVIPNQSESAVIETVGIYGKITLEDATEVTCYEIILKPNVRLEYSKVAIQHYVRKLLTVGQAALINFISPSNNSFWRLTLVAKDTELKNEKITEKTTNAKRYTYLLGPSETCKTPAERFEFLSIETKLDLDILVKAFSVERLSKAFFDEYTRHYENFIAHLTKPANKKSLFNGDEKAIRDYSKKLLGRIVFLYFVQKKRWLGASDTKYKDGMTDFIMQLFHLSGSNASFYPNWLTKLFFDTLNTERKDDAFEMPDGKKVKIPFLNGGLFDKEEHDDKIIPFPANLFHNHDNQDDPKERGFLDFLNAFNFTIYEDSPDEKTVAVDPEMLGHIFENLLEDNKDKGAFYTPKEIVHYMCQESLIEYLKTHLHGSHSEPDLSGEESISIQNLVKHKNVDKYILDNAAKIDTLLNTVKICDPAIGSGAFPMGLLQEIYSIKEVIAYETGKEWKPAEVKENIIQNSIYGVDIEKGAVDIARLRFWLSLVVDEEKPKPLPNLDYKIVVGDSLVSKFDGEVVEIEWERPNTSIGKGQDYILTIRNLLLQIAEKQKKYFHPEIKNKKKLMDEIRNLKIELLINQLSFNKLNFITKNPETMDFGLGLTAKEKTKVTEIKLTIANYDNLLKKLTELKKKSEQTFNHFDWKLDFPEVLNPYLVGDNSGFDIIIANPPYISIENIPWDDRRLYESLYKVAKGRFDIYSLFIEKAFSIKQHNSVLTYIIPAKFLNNKQFILPRKMLIEHNSIDVVKIENKVFEEAQVDSIIFKAYPDSERRYTAFKLMDARINLISETSINNILADKEIIYRIETDAASDDLLQQIQIDTLRVKEIGDVKDGIVAGEIKDLLFLDKKKDKDSHKLYFGHHLTKYHLDDTNVWVNYKPNEMMRAELKRKHGKRPGLWLRDEKIFKREKILSRFVAKEIIATYDNQKRYYEHTLHSTHIRDKNFKVKYVLAVYNSSVLKFYYKKTNSQGGDIFPQVRISSVENLPIKVADDSIQNIFENLVDYVLFLKEKTDLSTDALIPVYFEQIINGMVYELYFPELLKKHNREIIKHLGALPSPNQGEGRDGEVETDQKKMKIITEVFNHLNAKDHPVKINLEKMKEIPEIRIIEDIV
jgi:hypothetical protein